MYTLHVIASLYSFSILIFRNMIVKLQNQGTDEAKLFQNYSKIISKIIPKPKLFDYGSKIHTNTDDEESEDKDEETNDGEGK